MDAPAEKQDPRLMREMFGCIAPRYDLFTRTFSWGMDAAWKRQAVEHAALPENALVLDLACGTADFSRLIRARLPRTRAVASDLSGPMRARYQHPAMPHYGTASREAW